MALLNISLKLFRYRAQLFVILVAFLKISGAFKGQDLSRTFLTSTMISTISLGLGLMGVLRSIAGALF